MPDDRLEKARFVRVSKTGDLVFSLGGREMAVSVDDTLERAILEAKQSGAALYDLNGLLNDGISKFKMLFIEEPTQWIGTFDKPLSPLFSVWEGSLRLYRRLFK